MTALQTALFEMLCRLERLGAVHCELYDSEAREELGNIMMEGFVRRTPGFQMPKRLGMHSESADLELRLALMAYIDAANAIAEQTGLDTFHARLAAFQVPTVRTPSAIPLDYDEFFGHTPLDWYDAEGNVLWDRAK